jgi:hypothetical protein
LVSPAGGDGLPFTFFAMEPPSQLFE